jgi:hypothetical protein
MEQTGLHESKPWAVKGPDEVSEGSPDKLLLKPSANYRAESTPEQQEDLSDRQSTSYPQEKKGDKHRIQLVPLSGDGLKYRRFKILQEWEGIVTEVYDNVIWAQLSDLTNRLQADESMELPIGLISENDHPLVLPGAVFYLTIGYETKPEGRSRVTEIRFRRTPRWTQNQIATIRTKAQSILKWLNNSDESATAQTR